MITGFVAQPHVGRAGANIVAVGGALFGLSALGFVYNMWRTFNLADARARARAISRMLPTQDES
jgi:hypothetical protein